MSELADVSAELVESLIRQNALWDELKLEQERTSCLAEEVSRQVKALRDVDALGSMTARPYIEMTMAKQALRMASVRDVVPLPAVKVDCRSGCEEAAAHCHDNVGGVHLLG